MTGHVRGIERKRIHVCMDPVNPLRFILTTTCVEMCCICLPPVKEEVGEQRIIIVFFGGNDFKYLK